MVAAVNVLTGSDTTDLGAYTTASLSITSGRMYLLTVRSWASVAATDNIPTVTGAGQTWDQVATRVDGSNTKRRVTVFRCIAASTTSGALTIDFATQVQIMCGWTVDEITSMATGANGANAIVQTTSGDSNGSSVTSFSLTLSAFRNVNNAVFAAIFVATAATTITQKSGYTELADDGPAGTSRHETQFLASPDTAPSWTLTSDAVGGAIAVEIAASTAAISLDEFSTGTDALTAGVQATLTGETGTATDALLVTGSSDLTSGSLWVGRFVEADPAYTLQNEIISYAHVDEGRQRPNIIIVDGELDSWTEYDREDLTSREAPITAYFDLPELHSPGAVAQRAIEEQQEAARAASPGGDIVWNPLITRLDRIYWIGSDSSKYEGRIEGIEVSFDQGPQPFQRCTIDLGLMVLCPPDEETTYLARDLFDRDTPTGLGTADTGGSWTTY